MAFWWVNHKQTFTEEIDGGYVWSPKQNRNGSRNETYINLTRTRPGDTVFSYARGAIRAIGVVDAPYKESERPREFGSTGNQWETSGWSVPVLWLTLEEPVFPKEHLEVIAPLLPTVNSPIQASGNGNQGCYLAGISPQLGHLLMSLADRGGESTRGDVRAVADAVENEVEERRIRSSDLPETMKEQLIRARRGQGLFRMRVAQVEKRCRMTGVDDRRLLVASHIKPWRSSTDDEKLDGDNGLLLSPHIDRLFDRGMISFTDDGRVLVADASVTAALHRWRIDPDANVGPFRAGQLPFLAYHREVEFRRIGKADR